MFGLMSVLVLMLFVRCSLFLIFSIFFYSIFETGRKLLGWQRRNLLQILPPKQKLLLKDGKKLERKMFVFRLRCDCVLVVCVVIQLPSHPRSFFPSSSNIQKDICFCSDDLIPVLKGHGVNIQKPSYYADSDSILPTTGLFSSFFLYSLFFFGFLEFLSLPLLLLKVTLPLPFPPPPFPTGRTITIVNPLSPPPCYCPDLVL